LYPRPGFPVDCPAAALSIFVMRWLLLLSFILTAPHAWAQDRPSPTDQLLAALQLAPNEAAAAAIENRIESLWLNQGTPAVSLLMKRAMRELQAGTGDATDDFSAVLDLQPGFAEAYNQRAVSRFQQGDYPGAIADIEQVLQREPRNFGALQNLSHIAEDHGDLKGAFAAWQKVLEIDPKTPNGTKRLDELKRKAFGDET
jgi:tetratricopeptide (TPR) repeat protein